MRRLEEENLRGCCLCHERPPVPRKREAGHPRVASSFASTGVAGLVAETNSKRSVQRRRERVASRWPCWTRPLPGTLDSAVEEPPLVVSPLLPAAAAAVADGEKCCCHHRDDDVVWRARDSPAIDAFANWPAERDGRSRDTPPPPRQDRRRSYRCRRSWQWHCLVLRCGRNRRHLPRCGARGDPSKRRCPFLVLGLADDWVVAGPGAGGPLRRSV